MLRQRSHHRYPPSSRFHCTAAPECNSPATFFPKSATAATATAATSATMMAYSTSVPPRSSSTKRTTRRTLRFALRTLAAGSWSDVRCRIVQRRTCVLAEQFHRSDRDDRNQGNDKTVFNERCSVFVAKQIFQGGDHGFSLRDRGGRAHRVIDPTR